MKRFLRIVLATSIVAATLVPAPAFAQSCDAAEGGFLAGLGSFVTGLFGRTPKAPVPVLTAPAKYRVGFDHFVHYGDADFPPEEVGGDSALVSVFPGAGGTLEATIRFDGRPMTPRLVLQRDGDKWFTHDQDGLRFTLGFETNGALNSASFSTTGTRPGPYDGYAPITSDSYVSVSTTRSE